MERQSLSEAIELIRPHAAAISMAANETIFMEGAPATDAYIILRGVVRLCMSVQGLRIISDFRLPGDPLGTRERSSHTWTAEAATDLDLLQISTGTMAKILGDSNKENGLAGYAWQLATDAWRFQRAIADMTPDQRLACFIVRLSQRTNTPIGHPMDLPMSRDDIACHLRLKPDEIAASFAALKGQHAIEIKGANCTILDSSAVVGLAVQAMLPKSATR